MKENMLILTNISDESFITEMLQLDCRKSVYIREENQLYKTPKSLKLHFHQKA